MEENENSCAHDTRENRKLRRTIEPATGIGESESATLGDVSQSKLWWTRVSNVPRRTRRTVEVSSDRGALERKDAKGNLLVAQRASRKTSQLQGFRRYVCGFCIRTCCAEYSGVIGAS